MIIDFIFKMHAAYNLGDSDSDDEGVDDVGKTLKEESDDIELLSNITKNTSWNAKDIEKVFYFIYFIFS